MNAGAFDTLSVARDLEAAGIERRHAEAHAEALRQAVSPDRDDIATKADIADLKADMLRLAGAGRCPFRFDIAPRFRSLVRQSPR